LGNAAPDIVQESVGVAVVRLTRIFTEAGIDTAQLDARLLTAAALEVSPDQLRRDPDALLNAEASARLDRMMHQRATERMPVSRIFGRREFWSLSFALSPATLDPRPDSETLVETALSLVPDRAWAGRILDLGTGTGCLLLAVLSERPAATGLGTDISADAVSAAAANARAMGLASRAVFRVADWSAGIEQSFDLILSNPPYIPAQEIAGLVPEVARHDPRQALDGGADGLDAYWSIASLLPLRLAKVGTAVLEIGAGQAAEVAKILTGAGLSVDPPIKDLAGHDRCLVCRHA
jgi:release factor glutamine methyltransferase